MAESRVSQHMVQVLRTGASGTSNVSQHMVQVLREAPDGIIFQNIDCTNLYSKETLTSITESGLSWAVLDNSDASSVTAILDQNNNGNIVGGLGTFITDATPGTYIVIVQNGTGSIGAYIMDVF